jgi:hypothetical protein
MALAAEKAEKMKMAFGHAPIFGGDSDSSSFNAKGIPSVNSRFNQRMAQGAAHIERPGGKGPPRVCLPGLSTCAGNDLDARLGALRRLTVNQVSGFDAILPYLI